MKIRDERIERQTLDLGREPLKGGSVLGPNVQVVDCRLNLANPLSVMLVCSTVTGTAIHAQKQAAGLNWPSVYFRGCTFTGKYFDTRFGVTSPQADLYPLPGGLEDCDFSTASLHNCDPETINFPPWLHVTVLRARQNRESWLAIPFDRTARGLQETIADDDNAAFTFHWPP